MQFPRAYDRFQRHEAVAFLPRKAGPGWRLNPGRLELQRIPLAFALPLTKFIDLLFQLDHAHLAPNRDTIETSRFLHVHAEFRVHLPQRFVGPLALGDVARDFRGADDAAIVRLSPARWSARGPAATHLCAFGSSRSGPPARRA